MPSLGLTDADIKEAMDSSRYPPYYTYRRLVLVLEARSMLGSKVVERYRWYTNAEYGNTQAWELFRVEITPDLNRADHVIVIEP